MTEELAPRGSSIDHPTLVQDVGSDPLLNVIVISADKTPDFSVGVTLAVNGCLVTGTLIGERRWATDLEIALPQVRDLFGTPFRKAIVDDQEPPGEGHIPVYVHLKNARYMVGDGYTPNSRATGFFWRGRLSQVSAWSFGEVKATP